MLKMMGYVAAIYDHNPVFGKLALLLVKLEIKSARDRLPAGLDVGFHE